MQQDIAVPVADALVAPEPRALARMTHDAATVQISTRSRPAADVAAIAIENAGAARLAEIEADWLDLLGRALEPNVFMDPALVRNAARYFPDSRYVTLLAWRSAENTNVLVGLWSLAIGTPPRSLNLAPVLVAPAVPHAYLATPVVDRDTADSVLAALLDYVERDARLPKTIVLDPIGLNGDTMQRLSHILGTRGCAPFVLAEAQRPMLKSGLNGKGYLDKAQSASSRKKLRQHRRRLEEKGKFEFRFHEMPDALRAAFDDFLRLEHGGWKGRRGSALLCDEKEAAFSIAMIAALAERKAAVIYALYLDGKPISMQIALRAGAAAFTWKTAYDESFRDFSPGMLLLEEYTREFLADRGIRFVDSCAYDDSSFMSVWAEREAIAQVWLDVRRGSSFRFFLLCRAQQAFLSLRSAAKTVDASWRRRWRRN